MSKKQIKIGDKFGKLKIITMHHKNNYKTYWICLCKCNSDNFIRIVREDHLLSGRTQSCGCLKKNIYNNMKK